MSFTPAEDVYGRFASLLGREPHHPYLVVLAEAVLRRATSFPEEEEVNQVVVETARKCLDKGVGKEVTSCVA